MIAKKKTLITLWVIIALIIIPCLFEPKLYQKSDLAVTNTKGLIMRSGIMILVAAGVLYTVSKRVRDYLHGRH